SPLLSFFCFFFYCYGDPRDLHSFPTRRSSDLNLALAFIQLNRFEEGREIYERALQQKLNMTDFHSGLYEIAFVSGDRTAMQTQVDRKSTRLNSSHVSISYAVFCLKKKKKK